MFWTKSIKADGRPLLSRHDRTVQLPGDEGHHLYASAFGMGYEVSDQPDTSLLRLIVRVELRCLGLPQLLNDQIVAPQLLFHITREITSFCERANPAFRGKGNLRHLCGCRCMDDRCAAVI